MTISPYVLPKLYFGVVRTFSSMKSATKLVLIAAVAQNGVIGSDGNLPWEHQKDMERFKKLTCGNPLIVGRRTHDNIVSSHGGTLPDRTHIVVTTTPNADHFRDEVITAGSVEGAIEAGRKICKTSRQGPAIYVGGGASIYDQTIDYADRIELTKIHTDHDGDAYFPELDTETWAESYRQQHDELDFVTLINRKQTASIDTTEGLTTPSA